jgi:sigma-B regulation protein RsbU (phosphoserine phosphatase)
MAVGWYDPLEYEEATTVLRPGDRLYLYSDGVSEAMSGADETILGDDRLLALVKERSSVPMAESIESLLSAVNNWCDPKSPSDDVSLLGCEFGGPQAS